MSNSYGEKIAGLRKERGMTQSELGEKLNVTFQAVSKWERGESLPDFETMSRLSKLFDVPLSYFQTEGEEVVAEEVATEPVVMLGVCKECGRVVNSGEEAQTEPNLICKKCADRKAAEEKKKKEEDARKKAEAEQAAKNERIAKDAANKNRMVKGLVVGAIVAVIAGAIDLAGLISTGKIGDFWYTVFGVIFIFTFVSQLFWNGAVRNVFFFGWDKGIRFPGLIFEWSLDGFKWLILMKLLFAVLGFIASLFFILFFAIISLLISPFTFIPRIIQVRKGIESEYEW